MSSKRPKPVTKDEFDRLATPDMRPLQIDLKGAPLAFTKSYHGTNTLIVASGTFAIGSCADKRPVANVILYRYGEGICKRDDYPVYPDGTGGYWTDGPRKRCHTVHHLERLPDSVHAVPWSNQKHDRRIVIFELCKHCKQRTVVHVEGGTECVNCLHRVEDDADSEAAVTVSTPRHRRPPPVG